MKTISTQYRDNESVNFKQVNQLLKSLEDEEFLTLCDDNKQNFIQVAFDEEEKFVYLLEMRLFQDSENFTHYRTFCNEFEQVLSYFQAFYQDNIAFDFTSWQDVTNEFLDTLTLDTRLGGEYYDGYIADFYSIMEDVGQFAEYAVEGDFVHIFDDKFANNPALVIYPNFDKPIMRYDVKFKNTNRETSLSTYHTLNEIEKVVQDFLAENTTK